MLQLLSLVERYQRIRRQSLQHCAPLARDDYGLQAIPETSPPKWHLAHTTWFFETFVLKPFYPQYKSSPPVYEYLFNSYYNCIGEQFPRAKRGLLSRPTLEEIIDYRQDIDAQILALLEQSQQLSLKEPRIRCLLERLELGLQHEQQHQELFFTDIKYNLYQNPTFPGYATQSPPDDIERETYQPPPLSWHFYDPDLVEIGHASDGQFCFDNELPRHRVQLIPFLMANRLVTNDEYLAFIEDSGYQQPILWLADGWLAVQRYQWQAPLYWMRCHGQWFEYTLAGLQPLDPHLPVCHVSAYEADAYARWSGARLATEFEWETVAARQDVEGHFVDGGIYHPQTVALTTSTETDSIQQLYGDLWEWTASAYAPYPGYRCAAGSIGEYNSKFMCNQLVLRGGSCVSEQSHLRSSYRNFFYPQDRWQFSGIRLVKSA